MAHTTRAARVGRGVCLRATTAIATRTFRLYRGLFAELTRPVRELENRGMSTNRNEQLQALLFYNLPETGETVEKLVRRRRKVQAGT